MLRGRGDVRFIACGANLGRIDGGRIEIDSVAGQLVGNERIVGLSVEESEDVWIKTTDFSVPSPGYITSYSRVRSSGTDDFGRYTGSVIRRHHGEWSRLATSGERHAHMGGSVILQLPAVDPPVATRGAPQCQDYECYGLVPGFLGIETPPPDFSSLSGKFAWIHVTGVRDFAEIVDPSGPVFVLMRAVERSTRRRGFGIATWRPRIGATFEWLSVGIAVDDRMIKVEADPSGNPAFTIRSFRYPDPPKRVEVSLGTGWRVRETVEAPRSPVSDDRPDVHLASAQGIVVDKERGAIRFRREGRNAELADFGARSIEDLGPGDIWIRNKHGWYRTVRPTEVLTEDGETGRLHPWPRPASGSCPHPFAVLDVVDMQQYDAFLRSMSDLGRAGLSNRWGPLLSVSSAAIVEVRIFGLVILGASFTSYSDARRFLATAGVRGGALDAPSERSGTVVCAHPIDPRPFVPSAPP
jgi:hypothetical protein